MADEAKAKEKPAAPTQAVVNIPGLGAVTAVAVKLPSGQIVLRHPSELQKQTPPKPAGGGKA